MWTFWQASQLVHMGKSVVVMNNKYFVTLVSVHVKNIALVGCTFTVTLARENITPTRAITRNIAR